MKSKAVRYADIIAWVLALGILFYALAVHP